MISEARWERYCELNAQALDLLIASLAIEIRALEYDDLGTTESRALVRLSKLERMEVLRGLAAKWRADDDESEVAA